MIFDLIFACNVPGWYNEYLPVIIAKYKIKIDAGNAG
jgi:hypothetical protein